MATPAFTRPSSSAPVTTSPTGAPSSPVDRTMVAGLVAQASAIRELTASLHAAAKAADPDGTNPRRAASVRAWAVNIHRIVGVNWVCLLRALETDDAERLLPWLAALVCTAADLAGPPRELATETARVQRAIRALSADLRIADRNLRLPDGQLRPGVALDLIAVMRDLSSRYLAS